jgi:hypothetical protein
MDALICEGTGAAKTECLAFISSRKEVVCRYYTQELTVKLYNPYIILSNFVVSPIPTVTFGRKSGLYSKPLFA